ncbi:conserved unknown protein [Ectocarpus siliculosus]|uniref:Tetratricopeptide repeat-containing protein n=1 Tax=Ectocarpus siliculosus TaxID=2880 RepID=D8LDS9_ECTSI|nr:conserved unknown protein [Ectocarpus siliculosus]|eukprot:CBN78486.1 conserved unknown protein [Ectocarpus siliculosus]
MGKGKQGASKTEGVCATDAATAYNQGLKLCGEGAYGKALCSFDRAIAFRVDCSHYFAARANCKQAMGKFVDAYHDYVSAIRLNASKCTYFSCRGLCLIKMGKLDAALGDFTKACELEPTVAVHHYQRASLLHHRLARPGQAVISYGECLANTGEFDSAMTLRCLHAKGACLFEEGRAEEAVADLSRAVEMSDPSPASLQYLAKALKAVGQEKRALTVLGEALKKWEHMAPAAQLGGGPSSDNTGRHEAFFDRGVIRLGHGDDAGALLDFNKAVELSNGGRGEYFVQRARARARVAMRSEGREEAMAGVEDIEKAMELESNNPEFLFTAGVLCSRMGEYERAMGHLQLLLRSFDKQEAASTREKTETGNKDVASRAACEFENFTASIAVNGQRPEGFLLRGRSLAGLSSHEQAIRDFTTALSILGSKSARSSRTTSLLGGADGCCRDDSVSQRKDEAKGDEKEVDARNAKPEQDGDTKGNRTNPEVMLSETCSPRVEYNRAGTDPHEASPAETKHPESHGDEGHLEESREASCRRDSRSGEVGDGMGEGGSVVGACHYARALSLQQLGRHADAVTDFDVAISEGPVSWQRFWHRATCLVGLGEAYRASAVRDLRACMSMAEKGEPPPEMRNFLFQVGLAYLRLGRFALALELFDQAWKEEVRLPEQRDTKTEGPTDLGSSLQAHTLFRRGWANKAMGNLEEAAADFEAARLLNPHLSVNYRNAFDTELVVVDDGKPFTQPPALFHSW